MPHEPTLPPSTRVYARLDRFQCECPRCAELIIVGEHGELPKRLLTLARQRAQAAGGRGRDLDRHHLVYNPLSQRLRCPWCGAVFCCGLLLYSMPQRWQNRAGAPQDAVPNRRILAALRHMSQGWWRTRLQDEQDEDVNVFVTRPCTCTPDTAPTAGCPVHGTATVNTAPSDLDKPALNGWRGEFAGGLSLANPEFNLPSGATSDEAKVDPESDEE